MNWCFRRSVHLPLGVHLNLSKHGMGISAGIRGARLGRDARGRRYTAFSIPGTGLYARHYTQQPVVQRHHYIALIVLGAFVILFSLVGR